MVSDSDLVTRLREILRDSDLDKATPGSVRRQLEEDFGVGLSDRKAFIREQIDIYLQTLGEEEAAVEDGNVKDEEEGASDEGEGEGEEEEEEEGESDGKGSKKRRRSTDKGKVKKRGGFTKLCSLSPQLQSFVGVPVLARTEVVKKIWTYIREKDLQDPKDRRKIICDETLRNLFRVNSINMFQMNKALAKHIHPLTAEDEAVCLRTEDEDGHDSSSAEEVSNIVKEEEEDGEEDEEGEEQQVNRRGKKQKSSKENKGVKKRGGGFCKLCSLSPQLQSLTGESELARTEVVKRMWAYIRENNLQDPNNKQNIICDESLRALFGVDTINMFQMNKALSKHIWPLNGDEAAASVPQREKTEKTEKMCKQARDEDEVKPKDKQQKKGGGLTAPLPLSDALIKFIGTGESELSRTDVIKRMWEYIKQNDLQDPSDKRRILCDDKLKELFEVDSFTGFGISKLLTSHFVKAEQ